MKPKLQAQSKRCMMNFLSLPIIALLLFNTLFSYQAFADAVTPHDSDTIGSGQLRLRTNDALASHDALLLDTHVDIVANAISTSVTLTQTFKNNSPHWSEGIYAFPLPDNAAVDQLQMQVGEQLIIGKIRKKKQAKAIYQAAVANGQKAALIEKSRDNLFTAKAGNIPPNDELKIILHYVQPTHYGHGTFSLRLPTTYTPRYRADDVSLNLSLEKEINQRTVIKNEPLPEPYFTRSTKHPLTIHIQLNAGESIESITSPSHQIQTTLTDAKQAAIIDLNDASLNKDFVLTWQLIEHDKPLALTFGEQTANGYFTALMVVPPKQLNIATRPREIVFIIDTSGSMSGAAIRQARAGALAALDYLRPTDSFNLVEFNSDYHLLFPSSQIANPRNIADAKAFIHHLRADGGTEMAAPLQAVLQMQPLAEHLKQVVFLTDGSVNNETALFKLIQRNLGNTRLFTVGIGSAPNSFFMRQAATFGRGTFTYIGHIGEVTEHIQALFNQLQYPALTDIDIALPNALNAERYPNPIADLYLGEPIVAYVKTDKKPNRDDLSISGQLGDQAWVHTPALASWNVGDHQSGLDKCWAREKINALNVLNITSGDLRRHDSDIEQLGLDYQLLTKKTSFVAIEETITRDPLTTPIQQKRIANQMPAGNTMAFPTTATSSTLTALLGILALLLAIIIQINHRYQRGLAADKESMS